MPWNPLVWAGVLPDLSKIAAVPREVTPELASLFTSWNTQACGFHGPLFSTTRKKSESVISRSLRTIFMSNPFGTLLWP